MPFFAVLLLFLVFPLLSLQGATTPRCSMDRIGPQLSRILGEVETPGMRASENVLSNIVHNWQSGRNRDIHIRSLYQMAYSFDLPPSHFVKSEDIRSLITNPQDLTTRAFLPDEEMERAIGVTNKVLVESIQRSDLTQEENAARLGINSTLLHRILRRGHVPKVDVLDKILRNNGDTLENFFRRVESREDFRLTPQREVPINTFGRRGNRDPNRREALEFLGDRFLNIQQLLKERIGGRIRDIERLTVYRYNLGKGDVHFNNILRTTLSARMTLELFFSGRPLKLEENFTVGEAFTEKYAQRAKNYVRTLILGEMDKQNLAHDELARRISTNESFILQSLRGTRGVFFSYLSLKAIVEDGLKLKLPRFFHNFEENLKSFHPPEHAPARTFISRGSPRVNELLQRAARRLETVTEYLDDQQLSSLNLDNYPPGSPHPVLGRFTKMANILHLALATNIPPGEILFGQGPLSPSLPNTLRYVDTDKIPLQLSRLAQAIEARLVNARKTRADIQFGSGLSGAQALNPIFEGRDHASLPQFLYVLEGLLYNPGRPGPENRVKKEAIEELAREILSEIGQRETN